MVSMSPDYLITQETKLTGRRQHSNTHQVTLDGLIREIKERLSTISMQQHVQSQVALRAGLLSTALNPRGCRKLVCRPTDLESYISAVDIGGHVEDRGPIGSLADALGNLGSLLLRSLAPSIALFPLRLDTPAEDAEEQKNKKVERRANGQHSGSWGRIEIKKKRKTKKGQRKGE